MHLDYTAHRGRTLHLSAATDGTNRRLSLRDTFVPKPGTFTAALPGRLSMRLRALAFDRELSPDELAAELLAAAIVPDDAERERLQGGAPAHDALGQ